MLISVGDEGIGGRVWTASDSGQFDLSACYGDGAVFGVYGDGGYAGE